MKVTQFGPGGLPLALAGWSTGVLSVNSNFHTEDGGLNAVNFVQRITANGSNVLQNPIVNFASGSNILLTLDQGPLPAQAYPSNTIRIHSTAGGGGNIISSNGSNSLAAVVNLKAGVGIALGVSGQDITITNTGSGGGGGGGGGIVGTNYVQAKVPNDTNNTNALAITLDSTPTNGNILILCSSRDTASTISSISQTNVTWTQLAGLTSGTPGVEIWKGVVSASPSASITVNYSTTTFSYVSVMEWAGISGTLDTSATNRDTAGTNGSHRRIIPITPTVSAALVICCWACDNMSSTMQNISSGPYNYLQPLCFATTRAGHGVGWQWWGKSPIMGLGFGGSSANVTSVVVSIT